MPGPVIRTDQYKGYPKWLASILAGSELTSLATPLQVGLGHGSIKWVREFLDPTVRRLNNKPGFLKRSLHLAKDPKTPYRIATGTNFDEALAKQLRDLPYDEAIDIIAKRNRADPKYVNPNVIRGDLITDTERIIDVRHPVSTQKVKELSDVFGSQYKSAIDSMRNPRATPKDRLDVFSSLQDADPYGLSKFGDAVRYPQGYAWNPNAEAYALLTNLNNFKVSDVASALDDPATTQRMMYWLRSGQGLKGLGLEKFGLY